MSTPTRAHQELGRAAERLGRTVGRGDPRTVAAELRVGALLRTEGDLGEAGRIGARAFVKLRKALGDRDLRTLAAATELAWTLLAAGELVKAERLLGRVHETIVREYGENSPAAAVALANLALARRSRGDLDGARTMQESAVKTLRAGLRRNHPIVLAAEDGLAAVAGAAGDRKSARTILERVLRERSRQLGPHHALALGTQANLACVYRAGGDLDTAEEMQRGVLDILESRLGEEHPSTLGAAGDLAVTLAARRDPEGIELGDRVLEARRRVLGDNHPLVIQSLLTYARAARGRQEALARAAARRAVRKAEETLGPDHPDTRRAFDDLADVLEEQAAIAPAAVARTKGTGLASEARAPVDNLAGMLTARDVFVEGDFTQRPLELAPTPRGEIVTRTAHVELEPTHPLTLGEKFDIVVFADRAAAEEGAPETELRMLVPPEVRKLELDVWLVTSRHVTVIGRTVRSLTIDRDADRSDRVRFRARVNGTRDEFPEDPALVVSFSYNGWPSGRVTVPVPLAGPEGGSA